MYQLWKRDEYGQGFIEGKGDDIEQLVDKARVKVTEDNFGNALTIDAVLADWESYFVEFVDEDGDPVAYDELGMVYAGPTGPAGTHRVLNVETDEYSSIDEVEAGIQIFIGDVNRGKPGEKTYYAEGYEVSYNQDRQRKERELKKVSSFSSQDLEAKNVYYIVKAK